jgi:outer membrane receptor protein involved in Fe transport
MTLLQTCFLLIGLTTSAFAQSTLSGSVNDGTGKPLPFTTIALLNAQDSSLVKGVISNESGAYSIDNIRPGRYRLSASAVGYGPSRTKVFDVTSTPTKAPAITLSEAVKTLSEVTVATQKPVFEQQLDKLVVNVPSIVTAAGSSALDILERSPGITVNRQNSALTMAGKSGVTIMINGKISRLPVDAILQILTGTNAANIEKIELITNPSARYDAEGDAGIINIILKKNLAYGTNGTYTLSAGYGYFEKLNGSVNLNHRTGKLNLFGDLSGQLNRNWRTLLSNFDVSNAGIITLNQGEIIGHQSPRTLNARLGFDYAWSKQTTIGGLVAGFANALKVTNDGVTSFSQLGRIVKSTSVLDLESNGWQHGMANLNLTHAFTDKKRLTVDADYLRYTNSQTHGYTNLFDYRTENRTLTELVNSLKTTPIEIWVFKTDYSQELGTKATLDVGAKVTLMGLNNTVLVERQGAEGWQLDADFSQVYDLTDNILAGYVNVQQTLSARTKLQTGLRYEHTHTDIGPPGEPLAVRRRYGSLFPSVFVSHELSKASSVQISYSRRIQRPSYDLLAPWILFTSPYAYVTGNPNLLPTFTDALQATYRFKSNYLLTVKYSHDRNALDRFRIRVDSVRNRTFVTPENVASLNTVSLTFSFPLRLTNWWQMQTNLLGVWQALTTVAEGKPVDLQQYNANLFTSHTFKLPGGFTGEVTTSYQTPSLSGISRMRALGSVNAGLRKKLPGNGGSLLVNISDIFWTNRYRLVTDNPAVGQVGNWSLLSEPRVVRLTYTRAFGSQTVKAANRRATGSDEERGRVQTN